MHLHLREGSMQQLVTPLSSETFAGAVIMPNLVPAVDHLERLLSYRRQIETTVQSHGHQFVPFMTLFFRDYSEAELATARSEIIGIKLYPAGATTNSEAGVQAMDDAEPTLKRMEEMGIRLLVHGETHGFVMDREAEFLSIYDHLARKFPKLQITMEHITTAQAVALLDEHENLFATVTLQHLLLTLDDLAGGPLRPHLFCKPIVKRPEDREALLKAALAAHPKLMFGSDSAPHPRHAKESCGCAAGCFTAPLALARLAELFAEHHALENLQAFVSDNAQANYTLPPLPEKTIHLVKSDHSVPTKYGIAPDEVIPFEAGRTLPWLAQAL